MENVVSLATSIVQKLFDEGYTAYFAGGWVRDLLLKKPTDEIDIATSASPEVIARLFPKTIPVGIAFGVMIVVLEEINFEVTTFRRDHSYLDGRHPESVDFSTPEKDAMRRDFTINGMFYDPLTDTIHDYVGGQIDLKKKIIRAIGDPNKRFAEDRLRMIRAIRFTARFSFRLDPSTQAAIVSNAATLFPSVSMERVWQEFNKMAAFPHFDHALRLMHRTKLLETIFPDLASMSMEELEERTASFPYFPYKCPTIVYLIQLFPNMTPDDAVTLCRYLKTTIKDQHLALFFLRAENFFSNEKHEDADWARFYAEPFASLFLQVKAAKLLPPKRIEFFEEHEKKRAKLAYHIARIETHNPVVKAAHLKKHSIPPSKQLGLLLKEAERIAINYDLHHPEKVIDILKQSQHWPR